jgi:hypothetical protein
MAKARPPEKPIFKKKEERARAPVEMKAFESKA